LIGDGGDWRGGVYLRDGGDRASYDDGGGDQEWESFACGATCLSERMGLLFFNKTIFYINLLKHKNIILIFNTIKLPSTLMLANLRFSCSGYIAYFRKVLQTYIFFFIKYMPHNTYLIIISHMYTSILSYHTCIQVS